MIVTLYALHCDVAILGGGIGGIYSAYQLNKQTSNLDICLIEKEEIFGGRVFDIQIEDDPDNIWSPLGAKRLDSMHYEAIEWFTELGINVFWTGYKGQMINIRGIFGNNSYDMISAFPTLNATTTDEAEMYAMFMGDVVWDRDIPKITYNSNNQLFNQYNSMQDYLRGMFGPEGYKFLVHNFPFRDDFTDNDIKSYIQFLWHEFEYSSSGELTGYPVGGLSEVVRRTVNILENAPNVKLYLNTQVIRIQSTSHNYRNVNSYVVQCKNKLKLSRNSPIITADKLIINIDPSSFKQIRGDIAKQIQDEHAFKDNKPIPVTVIHGIYETRWWDNVNIAHINDENIRRIWTTDNCINFMEMPIDPYSNTGTIGRVRISYSDGDCATYWNNLLQNSDGINMHDIHDEIQRSLQYLFSNQVIVPQAINITIKWHFQYPRAKLDLYEIEKWAVHPISDKYGISMVGEAWNVNKGWIVGAIRSAQQSLKCHFNLEFTDYWTQQ